MTIALLFGGQGTETPGMGLELAREHQTAEWLLRYAGELAGVDAQRVLSDGGPEFSRTSVVQPLLTAVQLGAWSAINDAGIVWTHAAGHSLGEIAAWCAAAAYSTRAALELASVRGKAMERETQLHPGGMLAISGTADEVMHLIDIGRAAGSLCLAAHNAPTEYTLSGNAAALAAVAARARTTRLAVSGAWHSPAMAGAIEEIRAAVPLPSPTHATVVANRTGKVATPTADIASLLAEQLVHPVHWAQTLQTLAEDGVDHFVVAGPGKLMRRLVLQNLGPSARVTIVERPDDVRRLVGEAKP